MFDVNDDAKGGFRRVEVLTGLSRRRRWSTDDKARIVGETLLPGARVSEVARRWQVCLQQVFGWRRAACRAVTTVATAGTEATVPDFVPIMTQTGSVANFLGGHATSKDTDGFIPPTNKIAVPDKFRLSSTTGLSGSCA